LSVHIGGSFAVLTGLDRRAYVWGANTNGELGLGDMVPRRNQTFLDSIEDKQIIQAGVGSTFAFLLG